MNIYILLFVIIAILLTIVVFLMLIQSSLTKKEEKKEVQDNKFVFQIDEEDTSLQTHNIIDDTEII